MNKFWIDSTHAKNSTSIFQSGYFIKYTNKGHNGMVELVDRNTNHHESTNYSIRFLRINREVVTQDFL